MTHNTPAPVADKALAERLARLAEAAQGDGRAFWRQAVALAEAHRSGQLITLAEAQAMVAAERERCAALRDDIADKIGARPMSSIHSALCEYANAIRAAAPGTKEGDE